MVKDEEQKLFKSLKLLSSKPELYVCNVEEAAAVAAMRSSAVEARAGQENAGAVIVSAKIESEIAVLERGPISQNREGIPAKGES